MYRVTTVFGYISSIVLLSFGLTLIILQNLIGKQRLFESQIKGLCRLIPRSFGIRVEVKGWPDLDPRKGYVFVSNHVNLLDPVLLFGHIPQFVRGVELESHFSWPLWGSIIKGMGNIPISQKDTKSALESLDKAGQIIREGTSIIIFPEGHRTRDGELQNFQRGPFRLARNAGTDMIPVALKGLYERKKVESFFIKPGKIKIIFSQAISAEKVQESSSKDLRNQARDLIQSMLY
ncbi:1-acyl-sn-glycerol-3-phosphate acyltransferase [Oceanispirochaeta sp.]|jgi:1-acyl-sn-glycerol-3-phosphate acyltransferase|uniref:lysophospholipid acyltransferase family protein n=1 Tax=Oceanispirochaeta sp. TaxID=2035350 RepID=UPI0026203C6A|nr:lysophospholipid acyltransferase family protein [Oceanispirochaeta sp.]MDA3958742.1 lysophospholipid acyltransferase family protein [Oceanispirochaeta sp.]